MWAEIAVALITAIGALAGTYIANRKTASLMEYRLEQLEKKVEIHNNLVNRIYCLEGHSELVDAELKRQNKRLEILEGDGK